jgi:hypothetical protein
MLVKGSGSDNFCHVSQATVGCLVHYPAQWRSLKLSTTAPQNNLQVGVCGVIQRTSILIAPSIRILLSRVVGWRTQDGRVYTAVRGNQVANHSLVIVRAMPLR